MWNIEYGRASAVNGKKMKSKKLFLIPGFRQKATDANLRWLIKFLKTKGFKVVGVPIRWNYRTMSDYANDFRSFYNQYKAKENYILGFSYGAVIAFMTANELRVKKIYLCSLSPDFKEDAGKMKPAERKLIGERRFTDVKTRSAREIGKNLKVPSVIFYGEAEGKKYPEMRIRAEETAKFVKQSKLVVVKGAPHRINHPEYVEAIKKEFRDDQ